ncbi:hypothetical protein EVAR_8538_1 [Eumeta japonica]|uniref:Uncharacterized protein n=1 Tax=Eumeta variegata TaxID=151549 RepID=A0A4C1TXD2_EUMVA|nr:hypothetical protein EVAR_8538_1 [Eumeta japonica]
MSAVEADGSPLWKLMDTQDESRWISTMKANEHPQWKPVADDDAMFDFRAHVKGNMTPLMESGHRAVAEAGSNEFDILPHPNRSKNLKIGSKQAFGSSLCFSMLSPQRRKQHLDISSWKTDEQKKSRIKHELSSPELVSNEAADVVLNPQMTNATLVEVCSTIIIFTCMHQFATQFTTFSNPWEDMEEE